jgi:hypothetical protein
MSTEDTEHAAKIERIIAFITGAKTLDEAAEKILTEIPDSRLLPGGNFPPEAIEGETPEQRLARINPEGLLVIDPKELPELFSVHYPALVERARELNEVCQQWQDDHRTRAGAWEDIADDAENAALADLIRQLDDFAKEVDETRKKVKVNVYEAVLHIDGWFTRGLSDPVMEVRGLPRMVSGKRIQPGMWTMQWAQTQYLVAKADRERREKEAAAAEAAKIARQKEQEARELAAAEAKRIAELEQQGISKEEATEIAQVDTDQAAAAADSARATSSLIGSLASQSDSALVRQHTAMGTTVGLRGKWDFEVTNIMHLCAAIGAPLLMDDAFVRDVAVGSMIGPAAAREAMKAAAKLLMPNGQAIPASFVTTDDKNIRAAITARTAPLREALGLRIFQAVSAQRRGG